MYSTSLNVFKRRTATFKHFAVCDDGSVQAAQWKIKFSNVHLDILIRFEINVIYYGILKSTR